MTYVFNEERVLLTQLGEEGVLYDIQSNEYFTLNETLFYIVDGIKKGLTLVEIGEILMSKYDIDENLCHQEIAKAIQQLVEKNILLEQNNA
ncbi:PqqD family protein [Aquirufa ecclesiirivi]|uniref:PqqD family protein n=1 Tax=Aquirufa ecclesiirivi TaxID=2715124 RepID=UPI0022A8CF7E|nr:PqqD family protein [Aquirufa ecclesiirivi]MCZ2472810.1 PqqD family protein [Aquirufa ecclesiirivi]